MNIFVFYRIRIRNTDLLVLNVAGRTSLNVAGCFDYRP